MKKIVSWMSILLLFPLVACSYSAGGQPRNILATPTLSAEMMQTQISQLLTVMPTTTGESGCEWPRPPWRCRPWRLTLQNRLW